MATRNTGTSASRLRIGESVLSAAQAIDTSLVKTRLARFEQAHRDYGDADLKVNAAESQLRAAEANLENCDALQDKAVGALARALIADGHPITNAFTAFGAVSPGYLMRLPFAEEADAVHQLVAAVQRDKSLGKGTMQAAQTADKAAEAVEEALVPVEKMHQAVREARRFRDVRGQAWDAALASLRHDTRAAARDGSPQLHAALFPPRPATKKKVGPADTPPVPDTPPAPTAPATDTSNAA